MEEGESDYKMTIMKKTTKRKRQNAWITLPFDKMEEHVYDINDDKNEKNYEEREDEYPDYTSPDDMEECVNDRNDNKNEKYDEEKEEAETTDYDSTTIGEGKGVIYGRCGKDVDVDEFDASTCSGDRFYGIFDKEE